MKTTLVKYKLIAFSALLIAFSACSAQPEDGILVKIETTAGDITIKLYDETPLHQKNFVKLVNEKFYDGILFHRVIKDFMIQAGDPDSKTADREQMLGNGGPGYTIDAEFIPNLLHKAGALSAARMGDQMNPEKKSSGSQFYIVQGKKYTDPELNQLEEQLKMQPFAPYIQKYMATNAEALEKVQVLQAEGNKTGLDSLFSTILETVKKENPDIKEAGLTSEQKEIYKTIGGTPFLDGNYTVFGEVIEGLELVNKIAITETDQNDRPLEDVKIISMKVID